MAAAAAAAVESSAGGGEGPGPWTLHPILDDTVDAVSRAVWWVLRRPRLPRARQLLLFVANCHQPDAILPNIPRYVVGGEETQGTPAPRLGHSCCALPHGQRDSGDAASTSAPGGVFVFGGAQPSAAGLDNDLHRLNLGWLADEGES